MLTSAAKALKTLAAIRYLGVESEDHTWVEIRDLREIPRRIGTDKFFLRLEDCLAVSLNLYNPWDLRLLTIGLTDLSMMLTARDLINFLAAHSWTPAMRFSKFTQPSEDSITHL